MYFAGFPVVSNYLFEFFQSVFHMLVILA